MFATVQRKSGQFLKALKKHLLVLCLIGGPHANEINQCRLIQVPLEADCI